MAADVTVRAVHISELVDPTGYLDGGELLLTTGMALPLSREGCGGYVRRLAERGVAALALGLGPVHHDVPTVLIRTCERLGMPLFMVPPEVPFQRVTRQFWSLTGGTAERDLQRALLAQHRLVLAAAAPDPVPQILAQLATAIDGHAVVTDLRGRAREGSPTRWGAQPEALERAVERLRHAGPRAAATFPLGEDTAVVHPVTSDEEVVSYLAVASPRPSRHTRHLVLMTLTLLGMQATHRRTSTFSRHPARAAIAHLVDQGQLEAVSGLAEHLGVEAPPARVRVVVAHGSSASTLDTLVSVIAKAHADHLVRWWGTTTERGAWLMLPSRLPEPDPHQVSAALADVGSSARIVYGPVVPLTAVHTTRTTLDARAGAVEAGTAQAWRPEQAVPFVTREWAEATLAPLSQAGEAILATVACYLRHRGSWERTATDLGLHRNSVRAHIARAERTLGANLTDPDTMARLWLALRETTLLDPPPGGETVGADRPDPMG